MDLGSIFGVWEESDVWNIIENWIVRKCSEKPGKKVARLSENNCKGKRREK